MLWSTGGITSTSRLSSCPEGPAGPRSQVPVLDDPAAVTALVPASLRPPRVGLFPPHRCSVQPTPKAGERAAADGKNRLHHPPALTCHSTWAPPGSLGLHWGNSRSAPSERGPGPHRDPRQRWRSRVRVSEGSVPGPPSALAEWGRYRGPGGSEPDPAGAAWEPPSGGGRTGRDRSAVGVERPFKAHPVPSLGATLQCRPRPAQGFLPPTPGGSRPARWDPGAPPAQQPLGPPQMQPLQDPGPSPTSQPRGLL